MKKFKDLRAELLEYQQKTPQEMLRAYKEAQIARAIEKARTKKVNNRSLEGNNMTKISRDFRAAEKEHQNKVQENNDPPYEIRRSPDSTNNNKKVTNLRKQYELYRNSYMKTGNTEDRDKAERILKLMNQENQEQEIKFATNKPKIE